MKAAVHNLLVFLTLASAAFFSCGPRGSRVVNSTDVFEAPEIVQKSYERCVGENCVTVDLVFPHYTGSDNISTTLNEEVEEFLTAALTWGEGVIAFEDYEAAIDDFMASFEKAGRDGYNGMDWMIELEGAEAFRSKDLITLKFTTFYFTGGAHPNSTHVLLTFDLKQGGSQLRDEDLILDKEELLDRAMQEFRAHHEVAEGVSLEEDGRFFLEEGRFFLPQEMGYSDGRFVLLYNPYEIGPYVMGITELGIPLNELEGIVRLPVYP